jgi:hypothetical protein
VFDLSPRHSRDSAILDVTLTAAGVTDVRWTPVVIEDGLPTPARGRAARRILERVAPIR